MTPTTAPSEHAPARIWIQRGVVVAIWVGAVVLWRNYQMSNDLSALDTAQRFINNVDAAWWGVIAYVGVYLVRPIVLFPASVLTVVGGLLFGPVVGIAVVVVAANTSAVLAYSIGRLLGKAPGGVDGADGADGAGGGVIARWSTRMRENSFETVLIMRLLFLPYDLVNYASGILHIRPLSFLAATAIGSLPGTVSFVLLGASLDRLDQGIGGLEPVTLVAGVAIFVVSLAIARLLKRRGVDGSVGAGALTEMETA